MYVWKPSGVTPWRDAENTTKCVSGSFLDHSDLELEVCENVSGSLLSLHSGLDLQMLHNVSLVAF